MKIALVRYHDNGNVNTRLPASLNRVRGVLPPLGIAYLAAYLLQQGHVVDLIDAPAEGLSRDAYRQRLESFKPDLVGVTAMTSTFEGSLEAARIAKETGATVVLGGAHLSAYPAESLSFDYVDFAIIGDGEIPLAGLATSLEKGAPFAEIPGLVYKDGGRVVNNGPYIQMDLSVLPSPAYHLLPLNRYTSLISSSKVATLISARGCPFKCGFCYHQPTDDHYRMIEPMRVVDEMEMLVKKYGMREIMFYDDTLTMNREHIVKICHEIIRRKLKVRWESPSRIDRVDTELLTLMAKSGCFRIRFGVESGNENILKLMNKRITLKQVEAVFGDCRKIGIETFAYFIVGYARENAKTMRDTIDFAKKINPAYVMFTIATPYPFTHLYALAEEQKLVDANYWRDFTLGKRKDRLPYFVPDAEDWIRTAYREFYFRPSYVLRSLLSVRSLQKLKNGIVTAWGLLWFRVVE